MRYVRTIQSAALLGPLFLLTPACGGGAEESSDSTPKVADPVPNTAGASSGPTAKTQVQRGLALADQGDVDGAVEAYRAAIELDAEDSEAHFLLGRSLVAASRVGAGRGGAAPGADGGILLGRDEEVMAEAVRMLERAIELEPENIDYLYWTGRVNHVGGNTPRAVELLELVLEKSPEYGSAAKRLGLIHLDAGEPERARAAFEKAEELLPDDPGIPFQLGNVLVEDDPEAARDAFRRSVAIDPSFASSYNSLVTVLSRLGDTEGAAAAKQDFETWRYFEDNVRTAVSKATANRDDLDLQLAAGELYLVKRSWANALGYFQRAVAIDPSNAQAHFYSGTTAFELGALEVARDHLEETVYLQPNALEARLELIRVTAAQGDDPRTTALVDEIEPAASSLNVDGLLQYATALSDAGLVDKAAAHYRSILESEPGNQAAQDGLAALASGAAETSGANDG